jgi:hypothetical protein
VKVIRIVHKVHKGMRWKSEVNVKQHKELGRQVGGRGFFARCMNRESEVAHWSQKRATAQLAIDGRHEA